MLQKTILEVTDDWINISDAGGVYISPSKVIAIQNQSTKPFYLQQTADKPSIEDYSGEVLTNLLQRESSKIITVDENLPCWIRNVKKGEGLIRLYVWEWIFGGGDTTDAMLLIMEDSALMFGDEALSF